MKGKLITISGIDGSGKTTLINNLEKIIGDRLPVVCMSAYKDTKFTEELEEVAKKAGTTRRKCFSKLLRSITWKNDLIGSTVKNVIPKLEEGKIVILDRYTLCAKAFTDAEGEEDSYMDIMLDGLPKPDLGIYLDVDIYTALDRINQRDKQKDPYENKEGLVKLKKSYEKLMKEEDYPITTIDANLSQREVTKQVLDKVFKIYMQFRKENIRSDEEER